MNQEYIVSFNIIKHTIKNSEVIDSTLLNPNTQPILFYSNKPISFIEELTNNQNLYELLKKLSVLNYLNYTNVILSGIKYNIVDSTYVEEVINLQDIFKLADIEEGNEIAESIIYFLCNKMYVRAQGDPDLLTNNIKSNIILICDYIKNVYPNDYNLESIKMFIETKLSTTTRLNSQNIEYVMKKLNEII